MLNSPQPVVTENAQHSKPLETTSQLFIQPNASSDLLQSNSSIANETNPVLHGDSVHAEALLLLYQTRMSPQFPFVIIPDRTSAAQLAQAKPFLYRTVLMVASYHDKAAQTMMAKEIFEYLSAHMVIGNEKSLDLLQGLLLLIAWFVLKFIW